MSLNTRLQDLTTRVATEIKAVKTQVNGNAADLLALTTDDKSNLVAAINELDAELAALSAGAAGISDGTTTTTSTWSSQKITDSITQAKADLLAGAPAALDTLDELAAALADDANFSATVTTALGNRVRTDVSTQGLTTLEQDNARTNIGAGTSDLVIGTTAGTAADAAAVTTSLAGKANTSHTHTATEISNSTATGRSVLTAADAAAARTAIGAGTGSSNLVIGTTVGTAADASTIGNTETDFVAVFEAGLI